MTSKPKLRTYKGLSFSGFHDLAYWEWGPAKARRVAVCVHGLSRQGRDFDVLAQALVAAGYRVVCPDLVGRGKSGWLQQAEGYTLLQYAADMNALLARIDVDQVDWIGTSLGGLTGMTLASQPNTPIRRLVINDIGPFIPGSAIRRIGAYLASPPAAFPDLAAAVAYVREILAPYGELTDGQWLHLTEHSVEPLADGGFRLSHDPRIIVSYRGWWLGSVVLWKQWDEVRCPTLLLRGELSDLLLASTAREMLRRGPPTELIEFPGVGHVPALLDNHQIQPILEFLDRDDAKSHTAPPLAAVGLG